MQSGWSEQRFQTPSVTDNVFRLIALFLAAFLAQSLAASFFYPYASGASLADHALQFSAGFHPAQLLTHFIVQTPGFGGLFSLLAIVLILFFFGSELERTWGRHNFLKFVLLGQLGGITLGALLAFLPIPLMPSVYAGPWAGLTAVMVAYAMIWPDRQALLFFIIPVKMKYLVPGGLLLTLLLAPAYLKIMEAGGALAAALFLYYYARKGRDYSVFSNSEAGQAAARATSGPSWKEKREEKKRKERLAKKQAEINQRIEMKAEVDRLLEKISVEGMDSLSRQEKQFLDRASKEF